MEVKEKVFRHSFGKVARVFLLLWLNLFWCSIIFTNGETSYLLLLIGMLVFVVALQYATSSIKISNEGITARKILGLKIIGWSEIGRISINSREIQLHNRDEDLTLSIDSELNGYKEILDIIFSKRPDLVDRGEHVALSSRSRSRGILGVGFGLFLILGIFFIVPWLFSPQSVVLESSNLAVLYMFKEACYFANEIRSVSLEKVWTKNGYIYSANPS